jgi:hypothetical protein
MAISKNSTIDFAKIASEMRGTVARWYNAEIEIIDPNLAEQNWDEFTNEFIGNPETIIWSGPARVQPIRIKIEKTPNLEIMQGAVKGIRFQVPYDASLPLIRKGLQIRVTDGGEDVVLEKLVFLVRSSINSSYGWNRTIECDVDVKSELGPDGS